MTRNTKASLTALVFWTCFISIILGGTYLISDCIQNRIYADYKTGVIITPNPEYRIELQYSTCEVKGVILMQLKPRLFDHDHKVIKLNYTADRTMHLWTWRLLYGDKEVYRKTIDRDVKAGDNIQFIYVVD